VKGARGWHRLFLAALFIVAGTSHFLFPEPFVRIVPPFLPAPFTLVYLSGFFEIAGGLGLLSGVARLAAYGLIALLVAVFPANVYMALEPARAGAAAVSPLLLWLRLPLQVVLIGWLLWSTDSPQRAHNQ
jgi:uncharacterized membrane protein